VVGSFRLNYQARINKRAKKEKEKKGGQNGENPSKKGNITKD
jgi:hypothetical protein